MAQKALADFGLFHVRDPHRDHLKMHHVVARRGLVALDAGLRSGGGVPEIRERPLSRDVTLRAIVAKEALVPVLGLVATGAIQQCFSRLELRVERHPVRLLQPGNQGIPRRIMLRVGVLDLPDSDPGQGGVIHFRIGSHPALVFTMTGNTLPNIPMEGARLPLEDGDIIRMADDAVFCFNAINGRVAGGAVIFEKGMWL